MKMKNLPESERPYEKFMAGGVESLSDTELLAIIIKTGTHKESAVDIARKILSGDNQNLLNLNRMEFEDLLEYPGIGRVKAIQLKAVVELSRRISTATYARRVCFQTPSSIADYYMEQLRHLKKEIVLAIFLDTKGNFISDEVVSKGNSSFAFFPHQEIIKKALRLNAASIVVLHNHPSGDPSPSGDDVRSTNRLKSSAELLDLHLLDHIVIGDQLYFSFLEHNIL